MHKTGFGLLNEHSVAIILKELIRRAMLEIRRRRFCFNVYEKFLTRAKKIFSRMRILKRKGLF